MKIIFLILGILFALTSESYSKDKISLDAEFSQFNQEEVLESPELAKATSSPKLSATIPTWLWANGKPLSSSELLYLETELETPVADWFWGRGNPLTPNESAAMPRQLTFPNWIQVADTPITRPPEKATDPPARKNIHITSDHMTHDSKRDMAWAWGNVVIRLDNRTIWADKVKVDNKTGDGQAVGHVIITQNDGTRLKATKTLFNINNEQGRIFETRGRFGKHHYIKGKEITRYSKNHFKVKKGHITTCEGRLPDWVFEAESMDVVMGDRALFSKGVLKVRGVPIFYLPVGYIPINQDRKSGLLRPSWGSSSVEGVTFDNSYFWAIDEQSDATFYLDYTEQRGFRPGLEYRYTPSKTTSGNISASFIDDKITGSTSWKVDATHQQTLPSEFEFKGVLDLEGEEFNRNFINNTNARARRNTDSFANITKSWEGSSLGIQTRYRDSTELSSDQTFAELPKITYKTQKQTIGDTDFFFNQDTNFTSFLTDLDSDPDVDDNFSVQRFDFHPQISRTLKIAPWLSLTPTLGVRETIYSKGLDATNNNKRLDFFTRESFDFTAALEGPRFEKIFKINNNYIPKIKHLIEPRITYNYIPDIDEKDREKIKVFDGIDSVNRRSTITYSLTQRILQKELEKIELEKEDSFSTREALRFDISQSFDLIEATGSEKSENKRPFSDLRFDLDSRLHDNLELNFDSTFDVHENVLKTFNIELGIKPIDSLYLFFDRRYTKNSSTFFIAGADWNLGKGWRIQGTTRYDEKEKTFRENNFSLNYDNPCKCWSFNFDIIERENLTSVVGDERELKYLFSITLRGLGDLKTGVKQKLMHREFKSIK